MAKKLTHEEAVGRVKANMETGGTLASSKRYILVMETRANETTAELKTEKAIWTSDPDGHRHQSHSKAHACVRRAHMESIIKNEKYLRVRTGLINEQFLFLITLLKEQIKLNESRLWGFEFDRASDPGNRCLLSVEHAVLLYLTRLKTGRTQEDLEVEFGIDQSTISRYLDNMEETLAEILPTARNITNEMRNMKSVREIAVMIPGFDGTIIVDGTHSRIQRPSDSAARKKAYSGKKKAFTFNTAVFVTTDGRIVGISDTDVGTTHDITELRGALPKLEVIGKSMLDADAPPDERLELMGDSGYQGAAKYCPGANVTIPVKKPKGGELTAAQKAYNKKLGSKRVVVEHTIGDLKEHRILAGVFVGTAEQYNRTFNVITGLVNFKRMWPSRSSADKGGLG